MTAPSDDTFFTIGSDLIGGQPTVLTLDQRGLHGQLAGDAAGNRYVGIEVEIDGDKDEYTYLYLTAGQAELLAEQLLAAAKKADQENERNHAVHFSVVKSIAKGQG